MGEQEGQGTTGGSEIRMSIGGNHDIPDSRDSPRWEMNEWKAFDCDSDYWDLHSSSLGRG